MKEFQYIIEKIKNQDFEQQPFKHLYIEDFLSEDHFNHITKLKQINLPKFESIRQMVEGLKDNMYKPVSFPGCTTNVEKYILQAESGRKIKHKTAGLGLTEGAGISFRMFEYQDNLLNDLMTFLNSDVFLNTVKNKFEIQEGVNVETAIQKYLAGYEISPHPDIRKKALTYMVNINPNPESENLIMHTHYQKFKKNYKKIYDFWKDNTGIDRCWVPWDWTTTVRQQTKNNTVVIFSPSNDTLHAVKADYDHLSTQRTQIYGNLWYTDKAYRTLQKNTWKDLTKKLELQ